MDILTPLSQPQSKRILLGNNIWENSFPRESNSRYNYGELKQATDGGYIITGGTQVNGWDRDIVLIKTDSDGNLAE